MKPASILPILTLLALPAWAGTPIINYTPQMRPLLPNQPLATNAIPKPLPPISTQAKDNVLTLKDAVLIALHHNPNLTTSVNNRRLSRYDLAVAQQKFIPQFSLNSTLTYQDQAVKSSGGSVSSTDYSTITKQADVGPNMQWTLPLGTVLSAKYGYSPSTQSGPSANNGDENTWQVSLTQPLLKGFGVDFNEINLNNARDQQIIDNLNLEQTVSTTVSTIISDYYALVQAKESLNIARNTLDTNKRTLNNRTIQYHFGRVSHSDVIQAKIDVESQNQAYTQAKQAYIDAKAKLLDDMGLPGNTQFEIEAKVDITPIHPGLSESQTQALKDNRQYKIAQLNYKIAQRNLLTNENDRRWQLNLDLSRTHTRTNTNYSPDTGQPNSNNIVDDTSASLDLTVPLNDVTIDQSKMAQIVNDQNAQITLTTAKRNLQTQVAQIVNQLNTSWQSYQLAKEQLSLQKNNYQAAVMKNKFGKLEAFSLSQEQQQLISAENALVSAKINYIELKTQYEQMIGKLLADWHINLVLPKEDNVDD